MQTCTIEDYREYINKFYYIRKFFICTSETISHLMGELKSKELDFPQDLYIVFNGSYGRKETHNQSDIDLSFFTKSDRAQEKEYKEAVLQINEYIKEFTCRKSLSSGGNFSDSNILELKTIKTNIGGSQDTNETITKRILLITEGDIYSAYDFRNRPDIKEEIIKLYVNNVGKGYIPLHLLNDIIRYWRTITVDYAYKTQLQPSPKPWIKRNIKLGFSRKVLYASSLFSIAASIDKSETEKAIFLSKIFSCTPLERIYYLDKSSGKYLSNIIHRLYDEFLRVMSDKNISSKFEELSQQINNTQEMHEKFARMDIAESELKYMCEYRRIKDMSHMMGDYLYKYFYENFDKSNPVYKHVIF